MGRARSDLVGRRFGMLEVLSFDHVGNGGHTYWLCKCDCGNTKAIAGHNLLHDSVSSCGCQLGAHLKTHGESGTRLYKTWCNIRSRCYNHNNNRYYAYGGKGITVCDEWRDNYEAFRDWALANGYRDDLSIDRIDTSKGYSPDNCRFATSVMQANNKANNYTITYRGVTKTSEEWARKLGLNGHTLRKRLNSGMSIHDAFTTPIRQSEKLLEYKGEVHTQAEWGRITGLGDILRTRLRDGWTLEKAIETPVNVNRTRAKGLPVTYNGDTMPLKALCEKYGKNYHSVQTRLQRGWSLEDAMAVPASDGHHKRKKGSSMTRKTAEK